MKLFVAALCGVLMMPTAQSLMGGVSPLAPEDYAPGTTNFAQALKAVVLLNQDHELHSDRFYALSTITSMSTQVVSGTKYTFEVRVGRTTCARTEIGMTDLTAAAACAIEDKSALQTWSVVAVSQPWLTPGFKIISATHL